MMFFDDDVAAQQILPPHAAKLRRRASGHDRDERLALQGKPHGLHTGDRLELVQQFGCRLHADPSPGAITTWPFMPMIRPSNCSRKPPITESTTIRVATPSATPISEKIAMKETKPSRWRVAR